MPTTTIDAAWLANIANGGPDGPWQLNTAGQTYQLSVNVTALGSGFVINANNITLDFNGRTLSYGNHPQPTVLNPYFSDNVSVPGLPDNWTVTGGQASVVPITDHLRPKYGFRNWGANCLKLTAFNTTHVVESAAITIPVSNVLYCCNVLACTVSGSYHPGTSLKTEIIDQVTGLAIGGSSTATTDNLGNGASIPFYFTPLTTNPVKIRFTITPRTTGTSILYMSHVILKAAAKLRGVRLGLHTAGTTCTITSTSGQGVILCPNENPSSPAISGGDNSGHINVSNINATSSGLDSHVFNHKYCSGEIQNCTLTDTGQLVSNRQVVIAGIMADSSYQGGGILHIHDNTFVGGKHVGIFASQVMAGSTIHDNTIACDSRYTDGYAISIPDNPNGVETYDNTINQTCGRGILVDMYNFGWGQVLVHDNAIAVYEKGNLEYDPPSLEVTGIRIRSLNQNTCPDVQVYDNTITATTDTDGVHAAICIRPTQRHTGTVLWQFLRNTCKAINSHPSSLPTVEGTGRFACAMTIDRSLAPGVLLVQGNTFESNAVSLAIGEADSFGTVQDHITFRDNTLKQNTSEGTQAGYLPLQIGMQATIVSSTDLIGNLYHGATPAINYSSNSVWGDWSGKSKVVRVGWVVTPTVIDSVTLLPISGATCLLENLATDDDDSEVTNGSGQATLVAISDRWNQAGNNAGGRVHTVYGPHSLTVSKDGYITQTVSLGLLATNAAPTISLSSGSGPPDPPGPPRSRGHGPNWIGRYQLGQRIVLACRCRTTSGVPVEPDAAPVAMIFSSTALVVSVRLPIRDRLDLTGFFHRSFLLDSYFTTGVYRVVYQYTVSGDAGASEDIFEIVPGGNADGAGLAITYYERPASDFVLVQTDAGRLIRKRNPRL